MEALIPELIVTLENPLVINSNFAAIQARLNEELKKYEIEVTEETLPEAKKSMAELGAMAKEIDRRRIDFAKAMKVPITAWEAEAKKLSEATMAAREKIAAQTKIFDDKTRERCQKLMLEHLLSEYVRLEVRPEYQRGDVAPLVGISGVVKSGLAKAARESVEGLAMQGRLMQEKADGRMARVEADCRAAGVEPLERPHVASFIDADDRTFSTNLNKMIQTELTRATAAREKIQKEEFAKAKALAEEEARIQREKENRERAILEQQEKEKRLREKAIADAEEAARKAAEKPVIQPEPTVPVSVPEPEKEVVVKLLPSEPVQADGKKKMIFQFSLYLEVLAKPEADYEAVKKFISKTVQQAISAADHRIIQTEVV